MSTNNAWPHRIRTVQWKEYSDGRMIGIPVVEWPSSDDQVAGIVAQHAGPDGQLNAPVVAPASVQTVTSVVRNRHQDRARGDGR